MWVARCGATWCQRYVAIDIVHLWRIPTTALHTCDRTWRSTCAALNCSLKPRVAQVTELHPTREFRLFGPLPWPMGSTEQAGRLGVTDEVVARRRPGGADGGVAPRWIGRPVETVT